jgi:predicted kinase
VPKRFIVVSGLPASGKTTLALRLGPALSLPVIDKDAILDRLFERDGPGDEFWRRTLSRKSDLFFEAAAIASKGAVLVSHWRVPGMRKNSGTSLAWLDGHLINVHCVCAPEIAAARFVARKRHPGHLDANRTYDELLEQFRELERLGPPRIERSIRNRFVRAALHAPGPAMSPRPLAPAAAAPSRTPPISRCSRSDSGESPPPCRRYPTRAAPPS